MSSRITGGFVIIILWIMFIVGFYGFKHNFTEEWQTVLFFQLFLLPVFVAGFVWSWWSVWVVGFCSALIVLGLSIPTEMMSLNQILRLPLHFWIPSLLLVLQSLCLGAVIQAKERSMFELRADLVREITDLDREREQFQKAEVLIQDLRKENLKFSSLIINLTSQTKLLNENLRAQEVVKGGIEAIVKLLNPEYCAIYVVIPGQSILQLQDEKGTRNRTDLQSEVKFGQGLIGKVAERQQTIKSENMPVLVDADSSVPVEFSAGIPISYLHKLRGVMYVEKNTSSIRDELLILETLAAFIGMALHNSEVVEKQRMEAITDGLTKLYNHESFLSRLREIFAGSKRYQHSLSLIMLDIDYFKQYNDTNGHQMGDTVLEEVAQTIKRSTRASDIPARYGGEEFSVILTDTDIQGAYTVAEKVRQAIADHYFTNRESQPSGKVTCSIGVGTLNEKIMTAEELVEVTDQALYRAKHNGRNRVEIAS